MDDYSLDPVNIKNPPSTLWGRIRHLGPSLILTANIVGSGELIMTTTLGAKAGFVALWVILISCLFKVTIQLEFGKYAISSGKTTLQAFNELPGPRWRGISWSIWSWLGIKVFQTIQYGGIVGAVALVLKLAFPETALWIWVALASASTALLVFRGKYHQVERTSIILIAAFSLFTIFCVFVMQTTPFRISWSDLGEGLSLKLPASIVGVALAAFGLTGVSADEIISYPYWCIEKGYARYTGSYEKNKEWEKRARGWIRVMYLDGILSMLIYTIATAAFYILGAAILHSRGLVPEGFELITTLSNIYTESIGSGAIVIFLVGATVTLYSTLFVACASGTRMFTDAFAQCGFLDYKNQDQRQRWIRQLSWILPLLWAVLFLSIKAPVVMVMAGGISLTLLLILVVYATLVFRYRWLKRELKPGITYEFFLWISILAIGGVGVYTVYSLIA
jgi:Mn2+/Fe2+ NRAMP family transporter